MENKTKNLKKKQHSIQKVLWASFFKYALTIVGLIIASVFLESWLTKTTHHLMSNNSSAHGHCAAHSSHDISYLFSHETVVFLGKTFASKNFLILIGILATTLLIFIEVIESLVVTKLECEIEYFLKFFLLKKFRSLSYENRLQHNDFFFSVFTEHLFEVTWNFFRFPFSLIRTLCHFLGLFFFWRTTLIKEFSFYLFSFVYFSFLAVILISLKISRESQKDRKLFYKKRKEESKSFERQRNFMNLIDAMGLLEKEEKKEEKLFKQNQNFYLNGKHRWYTAFYNVPFNYLSFLFPFLFVFFSQKAGFFVHALLDLGFQIRYFFSSLLTHKRVQNSLEEINNFLSLSEMDNNLDKIVLSNEVALSSVHVENLNFAYKKNQEKKILNNYNKIFSAKNLNRLDEANGFGKSTLLRIILGLLRPQSGKVIITLENGKKYDLFSQINLLEWRQKNVAYFNNQTLLEEGSGSTGEKQWRSINFFLEEKKEALLWIFDEANNGLDKEKKQKFQQLLEEKVKNKKTVIYVHHVN